VYQDAADTDPEYVISLTTAEVASASTLMRKPFSEFVTWLPLEKSYQDYLKNKETQTNLIVTPLTDFPVAIEPI
jgi:hypothetical protein